MLIISGIFFQNIFVSIANRHTPVMHKRVRGLDNCPWLKRDMRERNFFFMKASKTRLSENWTKDRYFRNRVTGKIIKAKEAYNRRGVIEEDGHDSNAFWGTVKKLLPGDNKEPFNLSSDKRSIGNAFNKYFTNAVICLVDSLRSAVASACSSLACRSSSLPVTCRHPVFQFTDVTESFVLKQLKGLKTIKAVSLDDAIIMRPLTAIINASQVKFQMLGKQHICFP